MRVGGCGCVGMLKGERERERAPIGGGRTTLSSVTRALASGRPPPKFPAFAWQCMIVGVEEGG